MKTFLLAFKLLQREWYAGELRLLIIALLIAVTSMTSIHLFAERIHRAMENQASELLGGDLAVTSPTEIPHSWRIEAANLGLFHAQSLVFFSMLSVSDQLQLVNIKAVDANYPLRGQVKITEQANQPAKVADGIPSPGTIWVEASLLPLLQIQLGDMLTVGTAHFKVTQLLNYQPNAPGGLLSLSPNALMNVVDLAKTSVIQPGSRLQYTLFLAGNPSSLSQFASWLKPQLVSNQKLVGAGEQQTSLQKSLERVQHYLGLGSLISVILAGVALSVALKRFVRRHYDVVALMRCYGASSKQIVMIYIGLLFVVGLFGIFLGCFIGYFLQEILETILVRLVNIELSASSFSDVWFGVVAGLWVLFAFGLPPLWQLTRVPPLQILRRDLIILPVSSIWLYLSGLIAITVLIFWYIHDVRLTGIILLGCIFACLFFLLGAWCLVRLTLGMRRQVGVAWRYGLANLGRRWQSSVLQITAFGFTLMVLLLLIIVRNDLVTAWQYELPPNAPNYFVINIAADQVVGVKQMLNQHEGVKGEQVFPMVRGRLAELNHQSILTAITTEQRSDESLNRELNLSWTATLPHNNEIVSGRWWQPRDKNVISVEQGFAKRLGLKLGDELGFQIGTRTITASIISFRQLNWLSLQPNFYVLFPPGVIKDYPATYITSFYLAEQGRNAQLSQLIKHFPNLTVINIAETLYQVQQFLDQASHAIQYLFVFALLAGMVVLYASIYATLDQRLKEGAILRALGASRYQLLTGLVAEFVILGALSGLLAAVVANFIGMALGFWLFHLPLGFNFVLLPVGILTGAILVGAVGVFATRAILTQSPLFVINQRGVTD